MRDLLPKRKLTHLHLHLVVGGSRTHTVLIMRVFLSYCLCQLFDSLSTYYRLWDAVIYANLILTSPVQDDSVPIYFKGAVGFPELSHRMMKLCCVLPETSHR